MGLVNMNEPLPPFTSLELSRPISGAEDFIAIASHYSREIFGIENTGIVTSEPNVEESEIEGTKLLNVTRVGLPRATVLRPEELKLVILDRRIPRELNYASRFRWAAGRMIAKAEKVYLPVRNDGDDEEQKYRTSGLYQSLDNIGHEFDEYDQNSVNIECSGIQTDVDIVPSSTRLMLSLNPAKKATRMLIKQSQFCARSLPEISRKAGFPISRTPLDIEFGSYPSDASERQAQEYLDVLQENLPLRLVMGGVHASITV